MFNNLQIFPLLKLLRGQLLGGLQVGGGINSNNALSYIDEGASHVIVTSVCFIFLSNLPSMQAFNS